MRIGNINIENNIFLAPMAGVTDMPFRVLCKELGCGVVYTEMVSAKAILYNNQKTNLLLQTDPMERPVGVQLFGNDPKILSEMAKRIDNDDILLFDVNMGCPVPKVVNNGEGSALMKDPALIGEIVTALTKAVNKPVTVKIRKGFSETSVNAVEVARIAQECGAAAVAVHGRTREQYYSGKADWTIIKAVKDVLTIPVIGNGDIFHDQDALDMMAQTGCDGVMIARGAQGNPWIFREIQHLIRTGEHLERPKVEEIVEMLLRHGEMLVAAKGEYTAMREMRKHLTWYTKGMRHGAQLRKEANEIEDFDDFRRHAQVLLTWDEKPENHHEKG